MRGSRWSLGTLLGLLLAAGLYAAPDPTVSAPGCRRLQGQGRRDQPPRRRGAGRGRPRPHDAHRIRSQRIPGRRGRRRSAARRRFAVRIAAGTGPHDRPGGGRSRSCPPGDGRLQCPESPQLSARPAAGGRHRHDRQQGRRRAAAVRVRDGGRRAASRSSCIQQIVRYYSKSERYPSGVNLDDPFTLPARIREIKVERGHAIVVQ